LIGGATGVQIELTGHLGYISRPEAFAGIVGNFVSSLSRARPSTGARPGEGCEPHAAA
jgi:hypothetical protein